MGTFREEAKNYEPPLTHNVADLEVVPLDDVQIQPGKGKDKNNEEFDYKYFVLAGKEYRVPNSVFEEVQKILKLKPDVKYIKVTKTGTGLATRYKVDVVEEKQQRS